MLESTRRGDSSDWSHERESTWGVGVQPQSRVGMKRRDMVKRVAHNEPRAGTGSPCQRKLRVALTVCNVGCNERPRWGLQRWALFRARATQGSASAASDLSVIMRARLGRGGRRYGRHGGTHHCSQIRVVLAGAVVLCLRGGATKRGDGGRVPRARLAGVAGRKGARMRHAAVRISRGAAVGCAARGAGRGFF